jgi:hypothetical protein
MRILVLIITLFLIIACSNQSQSTQEESAVTIGTNGENNLMGAIENTQEKHSNAKINVYANNRKLPESISENIFSNLDFLFGMSGQDFKKIGVIISSTPDEDHIFDIFIIVDSITYYLTFSYIDITSGYNYIVDIMVKGKLNQLKKVTDDYMNYSSPANLSFDKSFTIQQGNYKLWYSVSDEFFYIYKMSLISRDEIFMENKLAE